MKRNIKNLLCVLLSLVLVLSTFFAMDLSIANAAAVTKPGDSLSYNLNKTTGVLTINGTGKMYDFRATNVGSNKKTPWSSDIDYIKTVIIGEGVTYVGQYSFFKCVNLTTVQLPSTVTEIGGLGDMTTSYGAFQECTSLKNINFPEGLTTIGPCAFKKCSALRSVEFPDSLTSLGYAAFSNCTNLNAVKYGSGLKSTGINAFYQAGVKTIDFGPSITSIDTYCFYGCTMTSLTIPEQIDSIGIRAFGDTYYFHSVTIYNPNLDFKGIIGEDPFNAGERQVNLTVYGHKGSTSETYAAKKNYNFVSIDDCDHEKTFVKIIVPATCTETGLSNDICENCQQMVKSTVIEALGHDNEIINTDDQSEANGHIIVTNECKRCGYKEDVVNHILLPKEETEEGDSESGIGGIGNIGGSIGDIGGNIGGNIGDIGDTVNPHYVWIGDNYTYTNTATCTRPGLETYTCTFEGCSVVERNVSPSGNHKVENWTIKTNATCTEDGERTGKCTVCDNDVVETIKAVGHTLPEEEKSADDKTAEDGHIYHTFVCDVCREDVVKPEHIEFVDGKYTPNVIIPVRCTTNGVQLDTCDICGARRTVTLEANGEHDWYETNQTEPTCTAVGKIFYACNNCNMTKSENIEALGHDYVLDENSCKDPTCTTQGYTTYNCSRCSVSKQDAIKPLGHTPVEGTLVINKKATCEEDGMESGKCEVCGENYNLTVKAYGHDYQDVIVPMVSHPGHSYRTPTCTRCGNKESSESIHSEWVEGYYTTEVTVEAGCLVQGRTKYTCDYCETVKYEATAVPLGHHYVATGTITENGNISYRCEFCNTITLQNPHTIMAMWDEQYITMTPGTNRTAVDNTSLIDANGDGYINARDYALLKNLCKTVPVPDAPVEPEEPGKAPTMEQFIYYHLEDTIKAGITYVDKEGNEVTIPGVKDMTAEEAEEAGLLFNKVAYPITAWPVAIPAEEVPALNDPAVQEDPYGAINSPLRYYYCATSNGTVTRLLKSGTAQITVAQQAIALPYYQAYLIANGLELNTGSDITERLQ